MKQKGNCLFSFSAAQQFIWPVPSKEGAVFCYLFIIMQVHFEKAYIKVKEGTGSIKEVCSEDNSWEFFMFAGLFSSIVAIWYNFRRNRLLEFLWTTGRVIFLDINVRNTPELWIYWQRLKNIKVIIILNK